jgi:hypothetical protein
MLSEALWALSHWGATDAMHQLIVRCPSEALGRDAYGNLLSAARNDCMATVAHLRHMARHASTPGLQAAVLNSALLRLVRAQWRADVELLLLEMADQDLWTPVTYEIHRQLGGIEAMPVTGRPPAPGRVDPGQNAHKYTRAVYEALDRTPEGNPAALLAKLEAYSRQKGWLKFGAEGQKGSVIDGVVQSLRKDALMLEFGTFLGYSSMRMAQQLGPRCILSLSWGIPQLNLD